MIIINETPNHFEYLLFVIISIIEDIPNNKIKVFIKRNIKGSILNCVILLEIPIIVKYKRNNDTKPMTIITTTSLLLF